VKVCFRRKYLPEKASSGSNFIKVERFPNINDSDKNISDINIRKVLLEYKLDELIYLNLKSVFLVRNKPMDSNNYGISEDLPCG
jgi:hypothetical protein